MDRTLVMNNVSIVTLFAVLLSGGGAYAQDNIIAESCFPIERASKRLKATNMKPGRRDTVDSFLEAYFVEIENRSLPMKLYLKHEGKREDFVVSKNGEVKEFHTKVFRAPHEALICGPAREDGKIGLGMSTAVRFKNRSSIHMMTEIFDGMKDGKSHHKNNLGGAKALFVPKMTHIAIIYDAADATPNVSATVNDESIPVVLEPYGEMWVIDVKALKDSEAETITIGGGSYELFPVPSIKKMKSLGIK